MIITITLIAAFSIASIIIAWLFRQQLAQQLPSKAAMNNFSIVALVVLLLSIGLAPSIATLITTVNLMPPLFKAAVSVVAAGSIIFVGCSKNTEPPKQPAIQWTAPDTGYHAESPPINLQEAK